MLLEDTFSVPGYQLTSPNWRGIWNGLLGIWMVLNRGATAVSKLTSSHSALASCVSTSSSPELPVVESMAAFRLDCHSSNMRGFSPAGSRIWAVSRLRTHARSRGSRPMYLP